jgi:hypothetical protein
MVNEDPRTALDRLIAENGTDYAAMSKLLGRNVAYVQQFIKRGTPRILPEAERGKLARYFGVDEQLLGAASLAPQKRGLRLIPKLAVGASAGPGALNDAETLAGKIGFDEKWLRTLGVDPGQVSLIRVEGDSMLPTLADGDDIMVDRAASTAPLRDGIHVIRMDDALMVKRLAKGPMGRLSVLSDNPEHPCFPNIDGAGITIIGRVVWAGRRL